MAKAFSQVANPVKKELWPMIFSLYEKVVYPGHGVAYINRIIEKSVGNNKFSFYELTFINKHATVLVPINNATNEIGIRELSSCERVAEALEVIAEPARKLNHYEFSASSWNKRNKLYQLKLRRGSILELSEIYRDLRFIETQKELSFGEKKLLSKAEALLVEEIALVQSSDEKKTIECLRSLTNQNYRQIFPQSI